MHLLAQNAESENAGYGIHAYKDKIHTKELTLDIYGNNYSLYYMKKTLENLEKRAYYYLKFTPSLDK